MTFKGKCLYLSLFYRELDQKKTPLLANFNTTLSLNRSIVATYLCGLSLINQRLT